jgi:uncharacterized protein YcnI
MDEETILHELNVPHQMDLPLKKIRIHEVEHVIHYKPTSKRPHSTTWSRENFSKNFLGKASER